MLNRIWTKHLGKSGIVDEDEWVTDLGADIWVPQEDIVIVGWSFSAEFCAFVEVDGFAILYAELTQSGLLAQDGTLAHIQLVEEWDSMLAEQENRIYTQERSEIVLPAGHGIPITDGSTLYLHTHKYTSAVLHTVSYGTWGIVYYVKGRVNK